LADKSEMACIVDRRRVDKERSPLPSGESATF
jgi:hypothetical protein